MTTDEPTPSPPSSRTRRTREEVNQVVESTRHMLALGTNDGDIVRALRRQYQISKTHAQRYLRSARKRNALSLTVPADEHVSSSYAFWTRKLTESEGLIRQERANAKAAMERIVRHSAVLEDPDSTKEQKEFSVEQLKSAHKVIENARRAIFTEQHHSITYRDRLDKLMGTYAPAKVAQTTTDGKDVHRPAEEMREPISDEEEMIELEKRYQAMQNRVQGLLQGGGAGEKN